MIREGVWLVKGKEEWRLDRGPEQGCVYMKSACLVDVGDGGGERHEEDVRRGEDHRLLPHRACGHTY